MLIEENFELDEKIPLHVPELHIPRKKVLPPSLELYTSGNEMSTGTRHEYSFIIYNRTEYLLT